MPASLSSRLGLLCSALCTPSAWWTGIRRSAAARPPSCTSRWTPRVGCGLGRGQDGMSFSRHPWMSTSIWPPAERGSCPAVRCGMSPSWRAATSPWSCAFPQGRAVACSCAPVSPSPPFAESWSSRSCGSGRCTGYPRAMLQCQRMGCREPPSWRQLLLFRSQATNRPERKDQQHFGGSLSPLPHGPYGHSPDHEPPLLCPPGGKAAGSTMMENCKIKIFDSVWILGESVMYLYLQRISIVSRSQNHKGHAQKDYQTSSKKYKEHAHLIGSLGRGA